MMGVGFSHMEPLLGAFPETKPIVWACFKFKYACPGEQKEDVHCLPRHRLPRLLHLKVMSLPAGPGFKLRNAPYPRATTIKSCFYSRNG